MRVVLVGGTGVVGGQAARILRARHPSLGLIVAGRSLERARALAIDLKAEAVALDISERKPLAAIEGTIDAVAALVSDPDDYLLRDAIARGAAYVDIARGAAAQSRAYVVASLLDVMAPVMFASNWMAGVPAILARKLTAEFADVDSVSIDILFFGTDKGGPDSQGVDETLSHPFATRTAGEWRFRPQMSDGKRVRFPSGVTRTAFAMNFADQATVALSTGAKNAAIRLALDSAFNSAAMRFIVHSGLWAAIQGPSFGWLRRALTHSPSKGGARHEFVVEVSGRLADGSAARRNVDVLAPKGQSHLTAIGVVANLERVLGLQGPRLRPGVAVPETDADPDRLLALLKDEGVQVTMG